MSDEYREVINICLERFENINGEDNISAANEVYSFNKSEEGLNFYEVVEKFEELLQKFGFANTFEDYVMYKYSTDE